jgi:hypothetical protein
MIHECCECDAPNYRSVILDEQFRTGSPTGTKEGERWAGRIGLEMKLLLGCIPVVVVVANCVSRQRLWSLDESSH